MTTLYMGIGQARDLIRVLKQVDDPMTETDAEALAQREGWTVVAGIPGRGFLADGPWDLGGGEISVLGVSGNVEHLTVATTAPLETADRGAIQDHFVALAEMAKDELGAPTATQPGPISRLSWRRINSTISLTNMGDAVTVRWATNDYQTAHDQSGHGDDDLG